MSYIFVYDCLLVCLLTFFFFFKLCISLRFTWLCVHAKSLQSYPTLGDSLDSSPPGSCVHGDSSGKNTGVSCHALLQGIFLTHGSNTMSLMSPALAGGFFTPNATWEALTWLYMISNFYITIRWLKCIFPMELLGTFVSDLLTYKCKKL